MPNIVYQKEILYPELLWERPVNFYKAKAGRIFIIAGSLKYPQAAIQTSEAAFKVGTGVQSIGFPESLRSTYKNIIPGEMSLPLPATFSGTISKKAKDIIYEQLESSDVVLLGPGISTNSETTQLIWSIVPKIKIPLIITSQGIDILLEGFSAIINKEGLTAINYIFKSLKSIILIISNNDLEKISKILKINKLVSNEDKTSKLSKLLSCTVVLNTERTIIANKNGKLVANTFRNKKDSLEGFNNILAGIVSSFVSQNQEKTWEAILTASYIYDLALDMAFSKEGEQAVRSSDILKYMKEAIRSIEDE